MEKQVMRPLTEAEMQSINGGGWLGHLLGKLIDWIFPDGKVKDIVVDVVGFVL